MKQSAFHVDRRENSGGSKPDGCESIATMLITSARLARFGARFSRSIQGFCTSSHGIRRWAEDERTVSLLRMNAPKAVTEREPIALRPFVGALLADFDISAKARHVTLDALVFLEEVHGNARLLRRLLVGLVGESLQRAPAGTNVSVVVTGGKRQAEFRIADEGAGIPAEVRDRIFDAAAAYGGRLSVTETDERTVVFLAFPCKVGTTAPSQLAVDGTAMGEVAKPKPSRTRRGSGVYARAGEPASKPAEDDTSRLGRAPGR